MGWAGQKVLGFFPYGGSSSAQLSLTSDNFVRLFVTAVTSACIFLKLSKLVNFCVAILIVKMEENMQHFLHIMLCYFKKEKNTTETQKQICAVYGEGAVTN